ncbi:MAG: hypothetical protein E2O54_16235 [Gammaproteobacteria bacterium]|nr:MAG: hypothetical protein E2O54_16235 [Gammaproteobacteria bacterium]
MKPCVFIHTNHKQHLGALLSAHSLKARSASPDTFDVRLIEHKDQAFMRAREGQLFLRDGDKRTWLNDDLQSFTPLRFMPPELMGYEGRALVIDPDIFAVGDVWELLNRDMDGAAIMCRSKSGRKGRGGALATSVMLLDCAQLAHWNCEAAFNEMFGFERDYMDWISLKLEDRATVSLLEPRWNDFDHLDAQTGLLHNTKRKTQPWKTGLPVDYRMADTFQLFPPRHWFRRLRRTMFGDYGMAGSYKAHPDPAQERFFFELLKECLEEGVVTEAMLREEMQANHLRHDTFEVLSSAA